MSEMTQVTERILDMLEHKFAFNFRNASPEAREISIGHADMMQEHLRLEELDGLLRSFDITCPGAIIDFWVANFTNKEREPDVYDKKNPLVAELKLATGFGVRLQQFRNTFLLNSNNTTSSAYEFVLTKSGSLSRNGGTEEYAIVEDSLRHRIIKELNSGARKTFHKTKDIAESLNVTEDKVHRAIGGIRKLIKKKFEGLEGNDFIKGRGGSGYRLGDQVRITNVRSR